MNLTCVVCGRLLTVETTTGTLVEAALTVGFVCMLTGYVHDLLCVDVDLYLVSGRRFSREEFGTFLVVTRYGFYYFGSLGLAMGLAAKAGHYYLVEAPGGIAWWLQGIIVGTTMCLPFLPWIFWRHTVKSRRRRGQ
jgi:hypothetical protein